LRQARDSNRISDFATIKSALALYQTDVATTTSMDATSSGATTVGVLYTANASTSGLATSTVLDLSSTSVEWGFAAGETSITSTASRLVNGTGWIPVNLTVISSGAPLGVWPVDPTNSGSSSAYVYAATTTSWKVATMMESTKYKTNGPGDVETNDGGNSVYVYEQGSNLAL